ncbi:MAG: ABC transporter ATP-binding protein/permease [Candidatus Rokubacteria bacterium]|nr:ABC transporter ATP-binding protein/permease [Candidatus Rokubacteria bacterium]
MALGRRVLGSLWPHRATVAGALAQVLLVTGFELAKPWPLKLIIDDVLTGRGVGGGPLAGWSPAALLLAACLALVLIYAAIAGLTLVQNRTTIALGHRLVGELRGQLYAHLQRLSPAFHSRRPVGDLLYRVTADTFAIQTVTMNGIFPALAAGCLLVGMGAVMLRIDWSLTLLALAVCPLLAGLIWLLNTHITAAATAARQRESQVYSVVQRAMSAVKVIQAFTREEDEHRRFMAASGESLAAGLRLYTLQTAYTGLVNVVIAVGTAVVVFVGARQVMAGTLTVGELVIFVSYLAALYGPINSLLATWGLVQAALAGLRRVFEILDVERDLPDGSRVFPAGSVRGRVTWRDVVFGYERGRPVLRGVSLEVAPGERVAIVGSTGAGKSTLVSLVPRFHDPEGGMVAVDGIDVRELELRSLRGQIAMVLQPPLVFPASIRENIAFGRPGASPAAIEAAARAARIHEAITRLPEGYDTVVGEQGTTLSEGERQRLTIARAILRDAPILILDEPTSSVDAETEALIMEGLAALTRGRTTLIIAHRLSTVRDADRIVVVRDGVIAEQGSFAELLARDGIFAGLYRLQGRRPAEGPLAPA